MPAAAALMLALVNGARAVKHERPLILQAFLQREAMAHGAARSHDLVRSCRPGPRAQTLAWGTSSGASPRLIVAALLASAPHRAILLDRRFRYTGIGVTWRRGVTTYTQDFAERC